MSDLVVELIKRGYEFDAFQLLASLEEYYGINAEDYGSWSRLIRLSANQEIAFSCSDIEKVVEDKGGLNIVFSFLGLLGISSPLPHYFTEYGAIHSQEKCALSDFLSIFDNRLYTLFFLAWKKCYPFPLPKNDICMFLKCQYPVSVELKTEEVDLPYCFGLMAGVAGNIYCLIEMISDYCDGVKVYIEQWSSQWVNLDCLTKLGADMVLSDNIVLGDRIIDCSGKFTVILELDRLHSIRAYNSESGFISSIFKIIEAYIPQYLKYEIKVKFTSENLIAIILGSDNALLGIDSICGESRVKDEEYWIVFPGKN
jgi:type VI secretion system protein ImpH